MVRVGLIGCGTIGTRVALALQRELSHAARLTAIHDANPAHARRLQHRLRSAPPLRSLSALIRSCDLVVEAASGDAVPRILRGALRAHRDVLLMSIGGLLRMPAWRGLVRRSRSRIYLPSGALAGLDGVKAMAVGRISRVTLTSRKPPRALASAPYVLRRKLRLERLKRPRVIFDGTPADVVRSFPQNTNVAAALALASGQPNRRIRVRVVADPTVRRNIHEVTVEGDGGRLQCRIESVPSRNPKTSELAVRSAVAMLRRIVDPVQIGT